MSEDAATGTSATAASEPGRTTHPSRAADFRRARLGRRRRRGLTVVAVLGVAVTAFAVLVSPGGRLGPGWGAPGGTGGTPPSGPAVTLGAAIVATATCSDGETTTEEAVPWSSASGAISTAEITLEMEELIDGDIDGGPTPTPAVSADYVCGAPLSSPWTCWYVVLQTPAGVNVAYFSYSSGWVNLDDPGAPIVIADGSTLVMISVPSYAGLSFALCAIGVGNATGLFVCSQL